MSQQDLPWLVLVFNRELKKNSRARRRQRQQNNNSNYTRQKAHVNILNKADIRAVPLSNETSTAPFPRQYFNNYRRSFRLGRHAEGS